MPGLNLLKAGAKARAKGSWRAQQQLQIDKATGVLSGHIKARALFPGSMLFNQIMLFSTESGFTSEPKLFAPESLSVAYEYCSLIHVRGELEHSLVIDAGMLASVESIDAIIKIIETDRSIQQIVLLGQATQTALAGWLNERLGSNISVTKLEPNWKSAYALHAIYRQARHVVFIDTMRVLDAAYTGCNCTLLAGTEFSSDPAFVLLARHLARVNCNLLDHSGVAISVSDKAHEVPYLIAQNQLSDVSEKLASANNPEGYLPHHDWLQGFVNTNVATEENCPVISLGGKLSGGSSVANTANSILDFKTRVYRKSRKLREDPRAFFTDSNSRVLSRLADVIPKKAN